MEAYPQYSAGLLWYRTPHQSLSLAAQLGRRSYVEREGAEPTTVLLNPMHRAEVEPGIPAGQLALIATTLADLVVKYHPDIRPNHLLIIDAAVEGQKNGQHAARHAGQDQPTLFEVNQ